MQIQWVIGKYFFFTLANVLKEKKNSIVKMNPNTVV